MKYLIYISAFILHIQTSYGQTAFDWSKKDCKTGQDFNLHNKLDSGLVIVQEYVMMDCQPCITAAKGLKFLTDPYKDSHPNRVISYQTAFDDNITCEQMNEWASIQGFHTTVLFTKGADEVSFYGGSGMPTIVILGGGNSHKIYYNKAGYAPSDNSAIQQAIDLALSQSPTGIEDSEKRRITIYPNPVVDLLRFETTESISKIELYSHDGKLVLEDENGENILDISAFRPGLYILKAYTSSGILLTNKIQKL